MFNLRALAFLVAERRCFHPHPPFPGSFPVSWGILNNNGQTLVWWSLSNALVWKSWIQQTNFTCSPQGIGCHCQCATSKLQWFGKPCYCGVCKRHCGLQCNQQTAARRPWGCVCVLYPSVCLMICLLLKSCCFYILVTCRRSMKPLFNETVRHLVQILTRLRVNFEVWKALLKIVYGSITFHILLFISYFIDKKIIVTTVKYFSTVEVIFIKVLPTSICLHLLELYMARSNTFLNWHLLKNPVFFV